MNELPKAGERYNDEFTVIDVTATRSAGLIFVLVDTGFRFSPDDAYGIIELTVEGGEWEWDDAEYYSDFSKAVSLYRSRAGYIIRN